MIYLSSKIRFNKEIFYIRNLKLALMINNIKIRKLKWKWKYLNLKI